MPGDTENTGTAKPGRKYLWVSAIVFLVFSANVIYGKIMISRGATSTPGLSDVGEFLTLFVAVVFFIAACVSRERAERESQS